MSFLKNYYTAKAVTNLATNTAPRGVDVGFLVGGAVVMWMGRALYGMVLGSPAWWANAWVNFDAGQWACVALPALLLGAIAWDQLRKAPKK